jgi:putative pyruvate formate lyase activating enzyme
MKFVPSYIKLFKTGELKARAEKAGAILASCRVCPHECGVNRTGGERGLCGSGELPVVSSYTLHHGEEPLISGSQGAGNIFFGNCNLRCIYCQNYEISQNWKEEEKNIVTFERLADIMLELQERGAHNIGFVSPTHFVPAILKSLLTAVEKGLHLPLIYNSNGYDSVEMLKLLDGIIDIYLPDCKYGDDEYGKKYSNAEKYFTYSKPAIKEMYRQTGHELCIEDNVVVRGLIIRHLVLPNGLSETENVFKFIAEELHPEVHVSLMAQYYPVNKASDEILLDRRLRETEYLKAIELQEKYNLNKGWVQEMESFEHYRPEFKKDRENPFGS